MANRTDEERRFYKAKLGSDSNNIVDLKRAYYKSLTGLDLNTTDMEFVALQATTDVDRALKDMWQEKLEDAGYSSNVPDGQRDFFENE